MTHHSRRVTLATIVLPVALWTVVGQAAAGGGQSGATTAKPAYVPPKTPDGQPDIQGFWNPIGTFYNIQDLEFQAVYQNFAKEDPARRGKSLIIDPPDGKIPYQPWALERSNQVLQHHANPSPQFLDPNARCFPHGVPRQMNNREFEILQPRGYVVVFNMAHHVYRAVPLDGRPHIPEAVKLWMGDSRGRWEGNALVVDVANNNDQTWFDVVGSFHSDALHVVERFTPIDANTIEYRAVMTDPKVYTRPWTFAVRFERIKDYGSELYEEACLENNERSLEQMLSHPR